jgi:hypothetical protein
VDTAESDAAPSSWRSGDAPTFNSPAADLNQLRNEARRIAESAPEQQVHPSVLDRARGLASSLEFELGLPDSADGLSYADLSVLLSQSR